MLFFIVYLCKSGLKLFLVVSLYFVFFLKIGVLVKLKIIVFGLFLMMFLYILLFVDLCVLLKINIIFFLVIFFSCLVYEFLLMLDCFWIVVIINLCFIDLVVVDNFFIKLYVLLVLEILIFFEELKFLKVFLVWVFNLILLIIKIIILVWFYFNNNVVNLKLVNVFFELVVC